MNPKILVIDDDPDVRVTYAEILGDHGFSVEEASTREEARAALEAGGPWDVVLLDEMLRGPGGSATATEMLGEIGARAPEARTIVITGFATPQLVRAALAAGAWDSLQKDAEFLDLLLPVRVRHAVEAARERRLRGVHPADLDRELRSAWAAAVAPGTDPHQKGRLLEETLALLFRTIPGLAEAQTRRVGAPEEFDVVVTNDSTDPVLSKEGSYFIVECKNWSRPVGPEALDHFRTKLRDRFGRVRLGLLVAVGGFTKGVHDKIARWNNEPVVIVPIDGAALGAWIDAPDRVAWMRERIKDATLRA